MRLDPATLQASARGAAGGAPEVLDAGAFLVCLHPDDDNRFMNHAVPAAGADRATVATGARRVREMMAARRRLPRVEAIAGAVAGLEEELEAQGWELESRLPVMAATPDTVRRPDTAPGVHLARVAAGDDAALVRRLLETQRGPFGLDPATLTDDEVQQWRERPGAAGVLATLYGAPAAAGQLTPVIGGLAELVGIATRMPYRRRGLAGLVTAELAEIAFERGATSAFLTPGDERAGRVYARAGFARAGEAISYVVSACGPRELGS